jgi:UV DNA damage endonuclease
VDIKIGYPCVNRSIGCSASRTFRLKSFSEARLIETVEGNLDCLLEMLAYNVRHGILFFRIGSDLIPFASHPVCRVPWQSRFAPDFRRIGRFIRKEGIRVSMHPDQFVLLNALDPEIVEQSIRELSYHAEVLDLMGLDLKAKIQIHVGGVYKDKEKSVERFLLVYGSIQRSIRRRLVIENDDRLYSVADCLGIHRRTRIPILLDTFHHQLHGKGEPLTEVIRSCGATWKKSDGPMMVDYSSQEPGSRSGAHAETIDPLDFENFIRTVQGLKREMDVMLEIKDKEKSALKALASLRSLW